MVKTFTRLRLLLFPLIIVAAILAPQKIKANSLTYLPAPVITFNTTSVPYGSADFSPATSTSNSTIVYTSNNPAVATIVNNQVHIVALGQALITAHQDANANFDSADQSQTISIVQANPTINFIPLNPKPYTTDSFTPATATYGAPLIFTSDNTNVAVIVNNQVSIVGLGTANITATVTGSPEYAATTRTTLMKVTKSTPVITFNPGLNAQPFTITDFVPATSNPAETIMFSSDNLAVASIVNNKVHLVGIGTANITATIQDNAQHFGTTRTASLTVVPGNTVITFTPNLSPKPYTSLNFTPATASEGAPITFTSNNAVATIIDNQVHLNTVGTASITATVNDPRYNHTSSTASIVVTQSSPVITFIPDFSPRQYSTVTFTPATATYGAPVRFTSDNPAVAVINGNNEVKITGGGSANITAIVDNSPEYVGTSVTQALNVTKADQVITFGPLSRMTYGDPSITLSATSDSGLPVSFTSSDPTIANVTGSTLNVFKAGTVTITAQQSGNNGYNAAAGVPQTLTIDKANLTIDFSPLSAKTYGDAPFNLSATTTAGVGPITYVSSDPTIAQIVGNTVTILRGGRVDITAQFAGNTNYNPAPDQTQTLMINLADQTITFNAIPDKQVGDADFQLGATASSGLTVSYTSSNTAVATVTGDIVHIVGAGTTIITASQGGDSNYNPAPDQQQTFNVLRGNQIITFNSISDKQVGDADFTLGATASSNLPVSYTSGNTAVATVTGNVVHIVGAGTVTITASQGGDSNYNPAPDKQQTFNVIRGNQTITFNAIPNKQVGDPDFQLDATATSGLPVSFTSSNTAVATVSGNVVHIVGAGTTTITATQGGDSNYNPATPSQQQSLTVIPGNQTITFNAIPDKQMGDPDFQLGATASSGLPVSYTSSNTAVATVSGNTVHIVGKGTTTITAIQNGNADYNAAASVSQPFSVTGIPQTITFNPIPAKTTQDADFQLNATASSGLPVSYTSSNTAVATVSGNIVHIVGAGVTIITAQQGGDAVYSAAPDNVQPLTVNKLDQTINFAAVSDKNYTDPDFTLTATATSGLPVTFTSSNTGVATITGNTVHLVGPGSVVITASQAGNSNYNAAASVQQTLTVTGFDPQIITFAAIPAKVYGDADFNANASSNTATPLSYTSSNTAVATINSSGVIHIVGVGSTTLSVAQAGTAAYTPAVTVYQTLNVTKASLTITADNKSKAYGSSNPALTVSYSGFVNGEGPANLTTQPVLTTTATTMSARGTTYPITVSGASAANYDITYVQGTLTVIQGTLLITANNQSKTYGNANPALTYTYSGFASGDNVANSLTATPTASTTADATSGAGTYAIKVSGAASAKYILQYTDGTLTINKAVVTVTAENKTRAYGDPNPTFTATYSGFVNNDNASSINTLPVLTTTATPTSPLGTYPIMPGGGADANYTFTYVGGTLTVTIGTRDIVFNSIQAKTYGDADFDAGAIATSGESIIYTSSNTAVATIVNGKVHITGAGIATITAAVPANANYTTNPVVSQLLIVNKASQTIVFANIPVQSRGETYDLSNIKSTSGLPVTIVSVDPMIASVTGNKLNNLRIGITNIVASQAGNANYLPAISVTQQVTVQDPSGHEILVHQAVSPNADGINDVLYIEGIGEHPDNRVTLINRNGVKVYEINGYDNSIRRFDGKSNITGAMQTPGTYFYLVEYTVNGQGRHLTGYFVLKY